jgi:hypothetical protein
MAHFTWAIQGNQPSVADNLFLRKSPREQAARNETAPALPPELPCIFRL